MSSAWKKIWLAVVLVGAIQTVPAKGADQPNDHCMTAILAGGYITAVSTFALHTNYGYSMLAVGLTMSLGAVVASEVLMQLGQRAPQPERNERGIPIISTSQSLEDETIPSRVYSAAWPQRADPEEPGH